MAIFPRSPYKLGLILVAFGLSLHTLLSLTHTGYAATTSPSRLLGKGSSSNHGGSYAGNPGSNGGGQWAAQDAFGAATGFNATRAAKGMGPKANAAFVLLARNSDLWELVSSIKQMEQTFNHWAGYPYVFLNEEPFSHEFKKYTQELTSAECFYGLIEPSHWHQPDWIDEEKATAARNDMIEKKVIYGHSVPYRNMCRFNSMFFYKHPLLANFEYYWRIEPSIKFYCDLNYDPFLVMKEKKAVYGFVLSLFEYIETIPTLWDATKEFVASRPDLKETMKGNALEFVSEDGGETYNRCHFWSNFEIGDLNFWRGEAYNSYVEFLDKKGGFYYERWGDAPVHSIGAALFAKKEQILFFEDIGYTHNPFTHCPQGASHSAGRCSCNPQDNFDNEWYSCTKRFLNI